MDVISGEVKNAGIARFETAMLFDMWEDNKSFAASLDHAERGPSLRRTLTCIERNQMDRAVLTASLKEEFAKIDHNLAFEIDEDELRLLLTRLAGAEPGETVVRELMDRMAGPDAETVSESQFLSYLNGLSEEVAGDAEVEGASPTWVRRFRSIRRHIEETRHSRAATDLSSDSEPDSTSQGSGDKTDDSDDNENETLHSRGQNLSRKTPGFLMQMKILMTRRLVQWWRMTERMVFIVALIFAATFFGVLDRYIVVQELWDANPVLYLHTALALLMGIFCLHIFGEAQPLFWRERARGMNVPAFYLSRATINMVDLVIQTFFFTAIYYVVRQPCVPYCTWALPFFLVSLVASAWGALVSLAVQPVKGAFFVTLLIFITCGLLGQPSMLVVMLQGGQVELIVSSLSLTRWSVGMNFYTSVTMLNPNPVRLKDMAVLHLEKDVYLKRDWWGIGIWETGLCAMLAMSTGIRVIAFVLLVYRNRDKNV
mmetsp:Transcript_73124/g.190443  ORF Transcript_73124/g.190443 Transcript_73124/m.190443 type:complete len:484 (-) Transcript_73124:176-1627(-)